MTQEIKYRYALDFARVVDINSASLPKNKEYCCLSCRNPVIPVQGNIQQHHFRHKVQCNCSSETYLHNLAKHMFFQTYMECRRNKLQYILEYKVPVICTACDDQGRCTVDYKINRLDLIHHFRDRITLETGHGGFIPDVLLKNGAESLFVEIAVTHTCDENKIRSGTRIIEINIRCEADIDLITSACLSEDDYRVTVHNSGAIPVLGNYPEKCPKTVQCFVMHSTGACEIASLPVPEYKSLIAEGKAEKVAANTREVYVDKVTKFRSQNKVHDCWLCKNHHLRKYTEHLRTTYESACWRKDPKYISSTTLATDCVDFTPLLQLPKNGLLQDALDKVLKPTVSKSKTKAIEPFRPSIPNQPASAPPAPSEFDVTFSGHSVECAGCGCQSRFVTSVSMTQVHGIKRSYQLGINAAEGPRYRKMLFEKILSLTVLADSAPLNLGAHGVLDSVLQLQCTKCSCINRLPTAAPIPLFRGWISFESYKNASFLDRESDELRGIK